MNDLKPCLGCFAAGLLAGMLLGAAWFMPRGDGPNTPIVGGPRPPIGMPSPLPTRNEKAVFGFVRMDRDGLTTLRLRAWDGGNANWDVKLFGSEEPVPDERGGNENQ